MLTDRVVEYSERFDEDLFEIYCFIAKDSFDRADSFMREIRREIETLPHMPYRCRQSIKSDDPTVRDFIFKGYVVPYRIKQDKLEIVGIFNQNEWEM